MNLHAFLDALKPFMEPATKLGTLALAGLIAHHVRTPKNHERAALLSTIANEAAALLVMSNPAARWDDALAQLVRAVSSAAGLPTSNQDAIKRAAAAALKAHGVTRTK